MNIGQNIAELRKNKGVTQEQLAKAVGVSAQAVSKWENGASPDVSLLPAIADYFSVSIDKIFGRDFENGTDISKLVNKMMVKLPREKRIDTAFEMCWSIQKALCSSEYDGTTIYEYRKKLLSSKPLASRYVSKEGFTELSISKKLSYFLLVPDLHNDNAYLLNGIDYTALFKDLSEADVFNAFIFLYKRDAKKAFSHNLLVKNLSISEERAKHIIDILKKYKQINATVVELDEETQEYYNFLPRPSFVALLFFARDILHKINAFSYYCEDTSKVYLA